MALQEMFTAQPNSPATELTAALTDVATTVSVLDASKLPDAPNIATIGVDESAETIKYTGKSGNTLTGVTRGFSGTAAKAWGVGVGVARYFTAYDADALRENVAGHSAELVSVSAQLADIVINAKTLGIKGDGTDETAELLSAINYVADNHYILQISREMTISVDALSIEGKQNFGILCEGTIKRLNDAPTIGAILEFISCSNFVIPEINFDGNGPNNGCFENVNYTTAQEQKHSLILRSCTNLDIGKFNVINSCGDGIYISNSSKNINIDRIIGKSDTQIGRNIISLISAQDVYINSVHSDGIGHHTMPGGIDIEPNSSTDIVRNVFINSVNITSGGSNVLSILNTNDSLVENIFIDKANIKHNTKYGTGGTCLLVGGENVTINQLTMDGGVKASFINVGSWGANSVSKNIRINNAFGKNGYRGIVIGTFNAATVQVVDVDIKATLRNLSHDGVAFFGCKNINLDIDIDSVGSDRFMVNSSPYSVAENISITGNISKRGTGLKAIISTALPTQNINWILQDLDFTGWGNDQRLFGGGLLTSIKKVNCPNLTILPAKPNFEKWVVGDKIENSNPVEAGAAGTKYIVKGWVAANNGSGGFVWLEDRALTGN
ncbi:hypothetical protein NST68_21160 [Paenibacillus sp. FSL E2-0230]|uniref:hypothetical protein n=1 Tax=Paenibacillus sp. FSL E2-0230 TaxID=2954727 RepID=UPI0030CF7E8E